VEFAGDTISGLALLELAGFNSGQPPQVYDWGGGALTVCQIAGEPQSIPSRCFGPISGPNWSDWSVANGAWVRRTSGVSGYGVGDGDLEGWTYTAGYGSPPPAVAFAQVCRPPASPTSTTHPQTVAAPIATARASAPASAATPRSAIQPATALPSASASIQPSVTAALPRTGSRPAAAVVTHPPWGSLAALAIVLVLLTGTAARLLIRRSPP
jgi:hypothetical protein